MDGDDLSRGRNRLSCGLHPTAGRRLKNLNIKKYPNTSDSEIVVFKFTFSQRSHQSNDGLSTQSCSRHALVAPSESSIIRMSPQRSIDLMTFTEQPWTDTPGCIRCALDRYTRVHLVCPRRIHQGSFGVPWTEVLSTMPSRINMSL